MEVGEFRFGALTIVEVEIDNLLWIGRLRFVGEVLVLGWGWRDREDRRNETESGPYGRACDLTNSLFLFLFCFFFLILNTDCNCVNG